MLAWADALAGWLTHGSVVAVVAQVRGDEAEVGRGRHRLEVGGQRRWLPAGVPGRQSPRRSAPSGTTWVSQTAVSSMIEWKYTKGSWRVAYPSPGTAFWVSSAAPIVRVRRRQRGSREGMLPMSSM